MAKIAVSGGAGFIGSHIVDALLADGNDVFVIDNLCSGSRENLPAKAALHVLDIREPAARHLLENEKPQAIIHCAAQMSVRESMKNPHHDVEVNVAGMVNLMCACSAAYRPHFTFLSSGGAIYGEQDVFPAAETHKIRPACIYGLSKHVGELYLEFWVREFGIKASVLRLANVYGPRQNPHGEAGVVAIFNEQLLGGKTPTIYGSGEQTRDFVYVKDVAAAAYKVSTERVSGTFNIGTGRETSINRIYELIASYAGAAGKAKYGPAKEGEQMRSVIDASLAGRTFGWKPVMKVEDGLKATTEWFRHWLAER